MPVHCIYISHLLSILVPVAANPILESVEHLVGLCILMGKERSARGSGTCKNKEGKNLKLRDNRATETPLSAGELNTQI